MAKFCPNCGTQLDDAQTVCSSCGTSLGSQPVNPQPSSGPVNPEAKSKIVAGLLGIFFGGIGLHNFYLGNTQRGIIQIVVSFVTCGIGSIWGFIEGVLILVGNISTDANGVPLKD